MHSSREERLRVRARKLDSAGLRGKVLEEVREWVGNVMKLLSLLIYT